MTQPCKICRGTGHVECPAQTCSHWCSCSVCNGTGKVEIWEDWSLGFGEDKVRAFAEEPVADEKSRLDRLKELFDEVYKEASNEVVEAVKLGKPVVKVKRRAKK